MTIARQIFSKRFAAMVAAVVLTFGVAAQCSEGGTYQGGGDSVPHYRR